jgi:ketosteroid isomerase-like protein
MKRRLALAIAALCVTATSARAQEPTRPDEAEIRAAVLGFKAALAAGDSTAAIGYLHPDLVVYEAGRAESLPEYRSGHLAADMEYAAAVATQPIEQGLIVREEMAMWVSEGESKGEFRGRQVESHGTETIVLIPTDAGWKILHVHWSSR